MAADRQHREPGPDDDRAMNWQMRPRRSAAADISEVADGYILYDAASDRLHHLNATAVLVLELCDGTLPAAELPSILQSAFALPAPPFADVEACLTALLQQGLLVDPGFIAGL